MQTFQLCACGAAPGYPHRADCPRPLFNPTDAQFEKWEKEWLEKKLHSEARESLERDAVRLSLMPGGPWLVVDCGTIGTPQYRLWREDTLDDQEAFCPDLVPPYELVSRAENGKLEQIA